MKELFLKKWSWAVAVIVLLGIAYKCGINHEYNELMDAALESKKAHPEITVFDGDIEPPMPDLSENNSTLSGIDSNKNGLRDDVEIWINRTYSDPNIRMAMKQDHRIFQKIMLIKKGDSEASNRIFQEEDRSSKCQGSFYENFQSFYEQRSKLTIMEHNIRKRSLQYNISRGNITVPIGGPVLDNDEDQKLYCKFKVIKN